MSKLLEGLPWGFTVVSEDESFFTYDSIVRKVWIEAGSRPVVTVTGSHRHSCVFGALSLDGRQLFRQYDWFNEDTFYQYLKLLHYKFPKCFLVLDRALQVREDTELFCKAQRFTDSGLASHSIA
jgi:hypothetical protein